MSTEVVNAEVKAIEQAAGPNDGRLYLLGAAAGLVLGLIAVYLFVRAADEKIDTARHVKTGEVIKLAIGVITLLRQVASLPTGS
ncbi:MAG: hypothetical protein JXB47_03275 [Anaerolineae bacterium]|nr:hypothetical protein [Anaerolineae bacterium]